MFCCFCVIYFFVCFCFCCLFLSCDPTSQTIKTYMKSNVHAVFFFIEFLRNIPACSVRFSYRFTYIMEPKWDQLSKFIIFIFKVSSIRFFLYISYEIHWPCFFKYIWSGFLGFRNNRGHMEPNGTNTENENFLILKSSLFSLIT